MINVHELRLGNYILQKQQNRISMVRFGYQHFELVSKEGTKDLYPVALKPEILEQCGFRENGDYPLLPKAREFIMVLAVPGSSSNEIRAYVKNNQECFGRAMTGGMPSSVNFYHLHQLQNIFHILTGEEIIISLK
jgi:hypothetical protein